MRSWWSTARSPPHWSSGPSSWAPTSSCSRRRSTSVATPTCCSELRLRRPASKRAGCASGASWPGPRPARSRPTSRFAACGRFPPRIERASTTAADLAERLAQHPAVEVGRYPGRPDHPSHATARSSMSGFRGVVTSTCGRAQSLPTRPADRSGSSDTPRVSAASSRPSNVAPPSPARRTSRLACCVSTSAASTPTISGATSSRRSWRRLSHPRAAVLRLQPVRGVAGSRRT